MATLTTQDGTKTFHTVRGEGRPRFIFIHGWCSNLRPWDAQTRYFTKGHRVLAADRRGHGRSEVPEGGYTTKQHAADIAAVARKEKIRDAIVVGHAGGGPSSLEFARSYPQYARAVVMVDAPVVGPKADIGNPKDSFGAVLGGMIDQINGKNGAKAFKQIYSGYFSEHAGRAALADAARTPRAVAVGVADLAGVGINTQATVKQIKQPVLWLAVTEVDQAAPRKAFRNIQFGQTVGSGNVPQFEVPDQTNAMTERFVSNL